MQLPTSIPGLPQPQSTALPIAADAPLSSEFQSLLGSLNLNGTSTSTSVPFVNAATGTSADNALTQLLNGKQLPQDWQAQVEALLKAAPGAAASTEQAVATLSEWISTLPDIESVTAPASIQAVKETAPQPQVIEIPMAGGEILTLPESFPEWPRAQQVELLEAAEITPEDIPAVLTQVREAIPTPALSKEAQAVATIEPATLSIQLKDSQTRAQLTATPIDDTQSAGEALKQAATAIRPNFDVNTLRDALSRAVNQLETTAQPTLTQKTMPNTGISHMPLLNTERAPVAELPVTYLGAESKIDAQMRVLTQRVEASAPTQTPSAPALPVELADSEWLNKLAERAQILLRDGKTEMRVRLDPSHLGHIDLKLSQQGDQTQVQIVATDARVRDALDSGQLRLRDQLAQAGVELSQFDVSDQRREQGQSQGQSESAVREDLVEVAEDTPAEQLSPQPSNQLIDQRV